MTRMRIAESRTSRPISMTPPGSGVFPRGGEHLHRALGTGAAGANKSVAAVHGCIFQDLTVPPAGDNLASCSLAKTDRDHRLPLHIDDSADCRGGETLYSHLPE